MFREWIIMESYHFLALIFLIGLGAGVLVLLLCVHHSGHGKGGRVKSKAPVKAEATSAFMHKKLQEADNEVEDQNRGVQFIKGDLFTEHTLLFGCPWTSTFCFIWSQALIRSRNRLGSLPSLVGLSDYGFVLLWPGKSAVPRGMDFFLCLFFWKWRIQLQHEHSYIFVKLMYQFTMIQNYVQENPSTSHAFYSFS